MDWNLICIKRKRDGEIGGGEGRREKEGEWERARELRNELLKEIILKVSAGKTCQQSHTQKLVINRIRYVLNIELVLKF
jgi:hypothetical protein